MTDKELIEEAAKAMADAGDVGWAGHTESERDWYRRDARVALAVFRERSAWDDENACPWNCGLPNEHTEGGGTNPYYYREHTAFICDELAEAGAKALESAADAINKDFQTLPSWDATYKAGERTKDWEKGCVRTLVDTMEWLRARAASIRADAIERWETA